MKRAIFNPEKYILRSLTFGSAVLMIISFFMTWWIADFGNGQTVQVFGWGLRYNLPVQLAAYIAADKTPVYQTIIAWLYLSLNVIIILVNTFKRSTKSTVMLGISGIGYIIYALVTVFVVVSNKIDRFNLPLQGTARPSALVSLNTSICFGFYLACFTGVLCLFLAIIHYKKEKRDELEYPKETQIPVPIL